MTETEKLAVSSLLVGALALAIKALAYRITGSIALLSDVLESIVDVSTATAALISIRVAARPADADHPYGHHKAEFFSAVVEGGMILVAAILILREAFDGFLDPRMPDEPVRGLLVNAAASVVNALWCRVLIVRGRRLRSPALVADGFHLLADVMSSVGVMGGMALAVATGWSVLDPLMAAIVAVNILWSGWRVTTRSLSGLLDEAVGEEGEAAIRATIDRVAPESRGVAALRTRQAGKATFVDFRLLLPATMSVAEADAVCRRIETAIAVEFEQASVTIRVAPESGVAAATSRGAAVAADHPG
jgi:cation diffusion facilitator family transporter